MIVYGNTRADLEKVQPGGTFFLEGVWNCAKEGPLCIDKPIHLRGDGGMKMYTQPGDQCWGSGSLIDNRHTSAEEAIYYDIPNEFISQGVTISGFSIKHTAPAHYAIRMRNTPAATLERIYIDSEFGLGGLFYDEYCFFMKARDLIIRDFSGIGVNIAGNGNDYTFHNCDVSSRRRSYKANTAQAAVHCINSGLNIHHGSWEVENDNYSGVGVRLFYDRSIRPASGGNAVLLGVYAEKCDIAVQIDATAGYSWKGTQILYPHWALNGNSVRRFTRGVEVIRGKNIYIESPQIYDWSQSDAGTVVFREGATDCLLSDKTHDFTGRYTDNGVRNRILGVNV